MHGARHAPVRYYWTGRYQEYLEAVEEVFRSADARANHQHAGWGVFSRARWLLRTGKAARAEAEGVKGIKLLRQVQDELCASISEATAAMARLRLGDQEGALRAAESVGEQYWGQVPTSVVCLDALEGLHEVLLAAWERAVRKRSPEARDLRRKVARSLAALDRYALLYPVGLTSKHLYRGRALEIRGATRRARRRYHKAIRTAQRRSMPYHQALAHYHLGRCSEGHERDHQLNEAERLFRDLECADQLLWVDLARRGDGEAQVLGVEAHGRRRRMSIA